MADYECPICYENLNNGPTTKLICNHTFCLKCIMIYHRQNNNSCPMCRTNIFPENDHNYLYQNRNDISNNIDISNNNDNIDISNNNNNIDISNNDNIEGSLFDDTLNNNLENLDVTNLSNNGYRILEQYIDYSTLFNESDYINNTTNDISDNLPLPLSNTSINELQ